MDNQQPDSIEAAFEFYRQGKLNEALSRLNQVIVEHPGLPYPHYLRGRIYADREMFRKSVVEYQKSLALAPRNPDVHYALALSLHKLREYAAAVNECLETMSLDPAFYHAYTGAGRSCKKMKQYHQAETWFRRAIALDPENPDGHDGLGSLLYEIRHYQEAEREFRHVLELSPQDFSGHYSLGAVLLRGERYDEAILEFREAAKIDPGSVLPPSHILYVVRQQAKRGLVSRRVFWMTVFRSVPVLFRALVITWRNA